MAQDKPKPEQVKVAIKADETVQTGLYSNVARITHSAEDFAIDFLVVHRSPPFGKLQSRVIMSPQHAKRFLMALEENIRKFEATFGEIQQLGKTPDDFGFVN